MAQITGYDTEPCHQCGGAGWYTLGHVSLTSDPRDGETIDPCDHCHGTGTLAVPVFTDDASQPTYEDLHSYPPAGL